MLCKFNTVSTGIKSNKKIFFISQNDEGAPLMCFSEEIGVWELQATLSYHGNCGKRPQPVIYNSLAGDISEWIVNTIGNNLMFRKTIKK